MACCHAVKVSLLLVSGPASRAESASANVDSACRSAARAGAGGVRDQHASVQLEMTEQPVDVGGLAPSRAHAVQIGVLRPTHPAQVREHETVVFAQPGEVAEVSRVCARASGKHDQRRRRSRAEDVVVQGSVVRAVVRRHYRTEGS